MTPEEIKAVKEMYRVAIGVEKELEKSIAVQEENLRQVRERIQTCKASAEQYNFTLGE